MYGIYNQVKFLKLQTSRSSRPGGHVLFTTDNDHLAAVFFPCIGLEYVTARVETFANFTQKGLNNSQQNLSLLNTEMPLIKKKAVLQNKMALGITTAL